jgi:hypothetical protein
MDFSSENARIELTPEKRERKEVGGSVQEFLQGVNALAQDLLPLCKIRDI